MPTLRLGVREWRRRQGHGMLVLIGEWSCNAHCQPLPFPSEGNEVAVLLYYEHNLCTQRNNVCIVLTPSSPFDFSPNIQQDPTECTVNRTL